MNLFQTKTKRKERKAVTPRRRERKITFLNRKKSKMKGRVELSSVENERWVVRKGGVNREWKKGEGGEEEEEEISSNLPSLLRR